MEILFTRLHEIIQLVKTNPIVEINAPTGVGKSTIIPLALASAHARIFVSVPTRSAAFAIYEQEVRNAAQYNTTLTIGYAAHGEITYDKETSIVYATTGHLRRKMLSYFSRGMIQPITFCDILIVDEIHSGSIDNTVILALWFLAYRSGAKVPRLILMSATPIELEGFSPVRFVLEVPQHPIQLIYHTRDYNANEENQLYKDTVAVTIKLHREYPESADHNAFLIFAPGSKEVEEMVAALTLQLGAEVVVYAGYSAMKKEEIQRMKELPPAGRRKIVVATNIIESAVTIEDAWLVIDTLTEKEAVTSISGGKKLIRTKITKDSAKQRMGRVGRVRPGICYRMCTEAGFLKLEQHKRLEIDRVPIYDVTLELLGSGLQPTTVLPDSSREKIKSAMHLFARLKMINEEPTTITVTDMGRFAVQLPLSVVGSAFLWHWMRKGQSIFSGLVLICLIDSYEKGYISLPRRNVDEEPARYARRIRAFKEEKFKEWERTDDVLTYLYIFLQLMEVNGGSLKLTSVTIRWLREHSFNVSAFDEMLHSLRQIKKTLERYTKGSIEILKYDPEMTVRTATSILREVYSDRIMYNRDKTHYWNPTTKITYQYDARGSISRLAHEATKTIIGTVTFAIGNMELVNMALSLDVTHAKPRKEVIKKAVPAKKQKINLDELLLGV